MTGDLKFWEVGSAASTKTVDACGPNNMSAVAVHNWAPVIACGSVKQKIKVIYLVAILHEYTCFPTYTLVPRNPDHFLYMKRDIQLMQIYNFYGEEQNEIRFHDGFMGLRIGPISCLSFHSYLPLLGAGATDSLLSIYAPATVRPK